ncbi:MAG: helix-turn-helix transcriptional regulator [Candidatus Woesearchaeota archaeon]
MKMLRLCIIMLVLIPFASAYNVVLTLKDSSTNNPVVGQVIYSIYKEDKLVKESTYFLFDGVISLSLDKGEYDIEFKYDSVSTGGKDLYSKMKFDIYDDFSTDVYMLPVGSVKGLVLDIKGRIVINATITADCVADYGIQGEDHSTYLGTFSYNYIPTRNCRIIAESGGMMGYTDLFVNRGELEQITITLDKNIPKKDIMWVTIILIILTSIISYLIIYRHKKIFQRVETVKKVKKASYKNKKIQIEKKTELTNKRSSDIMQTLKGRERIVVQFLLETDNIPMSKIHYSTGIPKTSLVRILDNLESRNILKIEKIGKMKRIGLTEWFKGK